MWYVEESRFFAASVQSWHLFCSPNSHRRSKTRIASGCTPAETQLLREFHSKVIQQMSDRFHVHFTPDYSTVKLEKGVHPFKYMNKPLRSLSTCSSIVTISPFSHRALSYHCRYGVRNWMEQVLGIEPRTATRPAIIPRQYRDDIVMLLDPDMVLLRPLLHDFTNEEVLWVTDPPATKVVRHGYPISQQDGYLGLDWMGLNWAHITNRTKGQFLEPPAFKDGKRLWIAGPPYLATVKDMYDIAELWTEYSPRVLDLYDDIFAGKQPEPVPRTSCNDHSFSNLARLLPLLTWQKCSGTSLRRTS